MSTAAISAKRVRQAREEANLSQVELAFRVPCSPRTIQYWESLPNGNRRNRRVHANLVNGLAKATGKPVEFFFEAA